MCEQRFRLATLLDRLSVNERTIAGHVINRLRYSKRIKIKLTGGFSDAPLLGVHRTNQLSRGDSAPLDGKLSPPFVRNGYEKAITRLGA